MLPALRHSEKGKTVEILKRSVVAKGWDWGRNEKAEHGGFLGQ